jgi:thiol:disulfide interchange protein
MKLWFYLLLGLVLVIGVSWLLAIAAGLLQYLVWFIILGGVILGVSALLFRPRDQPQGTSKKTEKQEQTKAERELKRLEKKQARERAR